MKKTLKHTLLLSFILASTSPAFADNHEHHHHSQQTAVSAASTDSVFNITDDWTAANGTTFQLSALGGKPTVVAMVYTSCQYVCPLTVQNIKRIERSLSAAQATNANFALFSLDPERDTPAKLAEFAKLHGINTPSWTLAQGSAGSIRKLAVTLGVKYKKVESGDYEHDATIFILDKDGVVKYQADAMSKNMNGASDALKVLLK
ncbi:SCO family protein [Methylotenera mobilis]|uniref:Electron transport protein SCO1/SenC n=1 Tax=Methylotenera mobilis (strain JLW8 / ATCC BAA-1282 / DSM 17540) TaxID=583345 RepID=C6WVL9_METML|nr:SCO family protein [Methylotenera mobilis]ACT47968.1 electron transport protein SCO1/SenC [Methylotenera mobilis JLW8]